MNIIADMDQMDMGVVNNAASYSSLQHRDVT